MYGLTDENISEMREIFASIPAIEEVILYGSRARGDNRRGSDIDITLRGKALTFTDIAWLDDKLYYSYIPYFFDTSIFRDLKNEALISNIIRDGKVIYRRGQKYGAESE